MWEREGDRSGPVGHRGGGCSCLLDTEKALISVCNLLRNEKGANVNMQILC